MRAGFDALAYWLIDYYVAATVVLIVVTIARRLISQPARRMALHWGALVGLALLAVLCLVPGWPRIDVMNVARTIPEAVSRPQRPVSSEISTKNSTSRLDLGDSRGAQQSSKSTRHQSPLSAPAGRGAVEQAAAAAQSEAATPLLAVPEGVLRGLGIRDLGTARLFVLAIFAVGSVLTVCRVIHGLRAARNVRLSASEAPRRVVAELEKLAGTARCPELLVSHSHPVPIVTGTLRPKILLPPQFADRERPDDCRSVLAHELAHIQNGDLWLLAVDRWLLPLFWLHPLYLRLRRSFRDDQELLADTFAASHSSRTDYADMLVRWARRLLAEKQARQLAAAVGVWDRPTRLADRISRLLHQNPRLELCCPRAWRMGSLLSLIALPILLSTATMRPDVSRSSNFVGRSITQSLAAPKTSCCCHRPCAVIPSSPEDRIRYSLEQPAIAQVERLGGSVKREQIGSKLFVTEVDMVFHYTQDGHRVENKTFTEEALPHIANFHHLRTLVLSGGQITDDGLRRLAELKELKCLILRDARLVSRAGVAPLVKLPQLRRLELTNAPIGDAGFAQLAAVQSLEDLSVTGSGLSDESLAVASRLRNLTNLSLDLGNRAIGREALLGLHALPNLKRLSLRCSEITDEALAQVASLTNLRLLSLGDSRVSRRGLASLRRSLPDLAVQTTQQSLRWRPAFPWEQSRGDTPCPQEVVALGRFLLNVIRGRA